MYSGVNLLWIELILLCFKQGGTLEFMKVLGSQFVPSDDSQTMTIEVFSAKLHVLL